LVDLFDQECGSLAKRAVAVIVDHSPLGSNAGHDTVSHFMVARLFASRHTNFKFVLYFGGMMTLGLNRGGALMLVILMPFLVPPLILGTQWAMTEGQAFYGYLLAGLLSLSLMTLPIATATVARIVVSR
jgi:ABC-type transport system involved in cytochrome c biogenesis permease component